MNQSVVPPTQTTERETLWAMVERTNNLSRRVTADICQRINTRTGLNKLDELMTLGERANALFQRIHARYEATLTASDRSN